MYLKPTQGQFNILKMHKEEDLMQQVFHLNFFMHVRTWCASSNWPLTYFELNRWTVFMNIQMNTKYRILTSIVAKLLVFDCFVFFVNWTEAIYVYMWRVCIRLSRSTSALAKTRVYMYFGLIVCPWRAYLCILLFSLIVYFPATLVDKCDVSGCEKMSYLTEHIN